MDRGFPVEQPRITARDSPSHYYTPNLKDLARIPIQGNLRSLVTQLHLDNEILAFVQRGRVPHPNSPSEEPTLPRMHPLTQCTHTPTLLPNPVIEGRELRLALYR